MKYSVISISDRPTAKALREFRPADYIEIPSTDAMEVDILDELDFRGLRVNTNNPLHIGELGIWTSTYDNWFAANISVDNNFLVFEDDVIIGSDFGPRLDYYLLELPDGWDFFSLWVPEDQRQDYYYIFEQEGLNRQIIGQCDPPLSYFDYGNPELARAYQGYGNIAIVYTRNGAGKLIDAAHEFGIYTTIDCFIFDMAHAGLVNGYTLKPNVPDLVFHDWSQDTTVRSTQLF